MTNIDEYKNYLSADVEKDFARDDIEARLTLSRRAKLGASCRVKVPVGRGGQ
jgi:hypothetical protein